MITKICRISGKKFIITAEDLEFYAKMEIISREDLNKLKSREISDCIGLPTLCPEEMLRRTMSCRNERTLHSRTCDKTGEKLISAYAKNVPFPVYKNEIWWGDSWDATDYGQDFDFSRDFFSQFKELQNKVPREGTSVFNSENCAYNGHIRGSKNCYLCALVIDNEDCFYSYWTVRNRDVMDCFFTLDSELCYECIKCKKCFDCVKLEESSNCHECYFSYQLHSCSNCIGCSNLRQKSYYVFNKKVSKEEFLRLKKQIFRGNLQTWQQGLDFFKKLKNENFHRDVFNLNCENCAGDSLQNCKSCQRCFIGEGSEDCRDCVSLNFSKDVVASYAVNTPGENELVYASSVIRGSHNVMFSYYIWRSSDILYSDSCISCEHCFGCVGLKHKKYCILNKQYSKEEYFKFREKIITHMKKGKEWGIFPANFTTFPYNETAAQEYFPSNKKEATEAGFFWRNKISRDFKPATIENIPDDISEVDDSICHEILACKNKECRKNYQIQKAELKFYRKMNLPIPRKCPDCRHAERMKLRNPRTLFSRECAECGTDIQTTFAPDRPEKVLCEKCYLDIVN